MAGSSSPQVVPQPMSDPSAVDPEEAFVASPVELPHAVVPFARCGAGFCVDRYTDKRSG